MRKRRNYFKKIYKFNRGERNFFKKNNFNSVNWFYKFNNVVKLRVMMVRTILLKFYNFEFFFVNYMNVVEGNIKNKFDNLIIFFNNFKLINIKNTNLYLFIFIYKLIFFLFFTILFIYYKFIIILFLKLIKNYKCL